MKERDYCNAYSLAIVRSAKQMLKDVSQESEDLTVAIKALCRIEAKLLKAID